MAAQKTKAARLIVNLIT